MSENLELELRALGRDLRTQAPSVELQNAVVSRVRVLPVPRRTLASRLRGRLRWLVAVLAALSVTTVAVSPVGATVADWLGFHGVMVREDDPDLHGDPVVPTEPSSLTLEEVIDVVGFRPSVPTVLGDPDGISVSADRRVVSMSWGSGDDAVHLDQFDASLDPAFWKTAPDAQLVSVNGRDALWFPTAHEVVVVPPAGTPETHAPRLAAPTLIWLEGSRTLRLEGDLSIREAQAIADSAD